MLSLDPLLLGAALLFGLWTFALLTAGRRGGTGRPLRLVLGTTGLAVAVGVVLATGADPTGTIAAGLAGLALSMIMPRRWRAVGAAFFACLLVASVVYVAYLGRATVLLGESPVGLVLGAILLVLEVGALGLIVASAFEMVDALCWAGGDLTLPPAPERWPVVCLQVPAYNEPPDLLIDTIRSLVAIDYPALRIQVIDNNTTDEALWRPVEAACASLRAEGHRIDFAHLPSWPGYKAGALNWGREHLADDVEILGIVDADYIVDPTFLRATIPHFTDPSVAFVQTPQDYRAWQESGFYAACYVGFEYFFKVGMVSRAHRGSIIFAGTMGLIRRSALDGVGGWDEAIITEDAEVSLRILATGARAVYVPTAFGHGIMPLSYEGLRKQRFRWAFGGIQILRRHWRLVLPWSKTSRLTLAQRYDYLVGGLWWFNDALTLGFTLFVFAGALGILVGRPFIVQRLSAIGVVLPLVFIVLNLMRYLWAMRVASGVGPGLGLAALRINLSLSWVIAQACLRGLVEERGVFLRTPKFAGRPVARSVRLVAVETTLGIVGLALVLGTLAVAGYSIVGLVVAGLVAWSVLIYGSATGFALGDPTRAPLSTTLREKAALELAPRVGRVLASRRIRISAVAALSLFLLLITAGLATESANPPSDAFPAFPGPIVGPFRGTQEPVASPTPAPPSPTRPSRQTAGPTAVPTGRPSAGGTPFPSPSPSPSSSSSGSPSPSPTTVPRPTPPSHPTPKPHPSPSHP